MDPQNDPQRTHDEVGRIAEGPTVVGIGASAGGLSALRAFFGRVPEDTGLAFVVVVHLSPDHESHLASLLQPHVRMPVEQVTETIALEPNRVFVIPPGRNLSAIDTHLRLSSLEEHRNQRAPIDHFFRTLAHSHDGHAIGVILTGTGSDGSLGLKEIKEKGGLTVVQDPAEAEYDGMPQSAVATGQVDLVLPLEEIPEAILRFVQTAPRVVHPEADVEEAAEARQILQKIFAQVRARTGRDFGRYKRSTILRRISRRMQLRSIEEFAGYLEALRERPEEVRALADDLLITVTSFFRDPQVFQKLEKDVIPALFDGKQADDDIRAWTVGCATGEEAYSIAMLLLEEAGRRDAVPRMQVFASDLHERSLEQAREGFYSGDVATAVGPERLRRFFVKETGGYRIRKEVRELVVFAPHNLLGDPPFSRIDLVSCRNVLIYLQRDAQRDVVELLHYALRPNGFLLLGASETVDATPHFFLEDKGSCLYRKRSVLAPEQRLPVFPMVRPRRADERGHPGRGEPASYGPLHQRIVERYAPPSLLLNPEDRVVHLSEHAGRYLVHPGGDITSSAFKLVRDELRVELRAAVHVARERKLAARSRPVPVRFEGEHRHVVVHARPALDPQQAGFVLVVFDEFPEAPVEAPRTSPGAGGKELDRVERLESELELSRQRLQAVVEVHETTQEEMKASNEELQSANEELRSTMEELETSKEELQSMNEELQTVNQENRHKVEELAQLSSDLQNLLTATDIATLFLDRDLRILRFTPKVSELFNVLPTDRGRLISDLTHRLGYAQLQEDADTVLERLQAVGREVQDESGRWYLTRVLPYRTVDDRIQGVVITFVEITERKRAEQVLELADQRQREFLATLAHELRNPLAALRNGLEILDLGATEAASAPRAKAMMRRQLGHLVRLVDDLLDVSRISRGQIVLRRRPVELSEILLQAIELSSAQAENRRVEFAPSAEPIWIDGDPVRLAQVFANLLSNAVAFTTPRGRIRLDAAREGEMACITVADDGEGIPAERLATIFELFTQHPSKGAVQGGLGIGLSLARRLVELHGGSIEARSPGEDQGSQFLVRLPLVPPPSPVQREGKASTGARVTGRRILVVDDNEDTVASLGMLLEAAGNRVRTALDGRAAMKEADELRPELVLLDIGLPGVDGYEVARRMRETVWGEAAVIVAVSGWGMDEDRRRSREAGIDLHLVKPLDLRELAGKRVQGLIEERGSRSAGS